MIFARSFYLRFITPAGLHRFKYASYQEFVLIPYRSVPLPEGHVLAFSDSEPLRPNGPNVRPHTLWIKYLQELLESVKTTRSGPARNIISLLLATFPGTIPGDETNRMSRHVTTVAARMELIAVGFSILHSEVLVGDVERSVLRNKLYTAVFDYFSCSSSLPTQPQKEV